MMLALGAAGSLLDALQSLMSPKSSSGTARRRSRSQGAANPFDLGTAHPDRGPPPYRHAGFSQSSPATMARDLAADHERADRCTEPVGTTNSAPTEPGGCAQDLFSQIDADGDGAINKSEFENALGAGGTNLAQADDVFSKLDANGDGSVSLDEMKAGVAGGGGKGGHHHHMPVPRPGDGGSRRRQTIRSADAGAAGRSSTSVTNSDGSTTTSITYADGSSVADDVGARAVIVEQRDARPTIVEQMIQRQAKALSSCAASLSVSA